MRAPRVSRPRVMSYVLHCHCHLRRRDFAGNVGETAPVQRSIPLQEYIGHRACFERALLRVPGRWLVFCNDDRQVVLAVAPSTPDSSGRSTVPLVRPASQSMLSFAWGSQPVFYSRMGQPSREWSCEERKTTTPKSGGPRLIRESRSGPAADGFSISGSGVVWPGCRRVAIGSSDLRPQTLTFNAPAPPLIRRNCNGTLSPP